MQVISVARNLEVKGTQQQIRIFEYVFIELRMRSSPPNLRKQVGHPKFR